MITLQPLGQSLTDLTSVDREIACYEQSTWGTYGLIGGMIAGFALVLPAFRCVPQGRCRIAAGVATLAPVAGYLLGSQIQAWRQRRRTA